jgi:hypothetical protein
VCAATPGCGGAGRDVTCALPIARVHRAESAMKNFVAPLSFTLAAAWVVILFVLVHGNP